MDLPPVAVEKRRIGASGPLVSPIGLGCWQFSQGQGLFSSYWPTLPDGEIREIVRVSLEGGVDWFDTAESYGGGASERALARALLSLGRGPGDVLIATKWFPAFRTARSIRSTIGTRLRNLEPFLIALYQVHQPFALARTRTQMKAMAALARSGRVGSIGVSNFSARKMLKAHRALQAEGLALASNQIQYSLLHRAAETNGVLEAAKANGISLIAYSPLAQGVLTGKFHDDPGAIRKRPGIRKYLGPFKARGLAKSRPVVDALREIASAHGATPAQVALAWVLQFLSDLAVAIPGATRVEQARDNAGAMSVRLTREDIDRLDRVSAPFKGRR